MTSEPATDVTARLARFVDGEFRSVEEGSVVEPFVHVFVHGWQPGYRVQERLLATADGVAALPAWDPRLVDARGRTLISDYLGLLEALVDLGPRHAVLWYSWLDESATDADIFMAWRSRQATQVNGRRLAVALQRSLASTSGRGAPGSGAGVSGAAGVQRVHLVGHSHGSAVVTHAALALERPPDQLTFLDAPEDRISRYGGASDLIDVVLPRLRPGRGRGKVFVDSYASAFGRPYHRRPGLSDVVDVQLTPPLSFTRDPLRAINALHLYPVDWYARSVHDSHRGVGYGWSPLDGNDPTDLHPAYVSPLPQRPTDLRRRYDLPSVRSARWVPRSLRRKPVPEDRRPVPDVELRLDARTTAAAAIVVSQPGDALIEFDVHTSGCTGRERLDVELDGVAAFTCETAFPVPASGRYVVLSDGRPGEHLLSARLTLPSGTAGGTAGGRGGGPSVVVGGVRLVHRTLPRHRTAVAWRPQRTAAAIFGAGAATGSAGTLVALVATGWTAHRVLQTLRRRRS